MLVVIVKSYSRAFGDGPRHFELWSSGEDDTLAGIPLSPNDYTKPKGGRLRSRQIPSTFPSSWYNFLVWYHIYAVPITTSNFDAQFLTQREAPELFRCEICTQEFNFAESNQATRTLKGSFSCRIIIRRGRCRFSASGKSTDLGRVRTLNLGYRWPATNQLRHPAGNH
ncbi:hypothetical protein TNCV_4293761 [Trichonephila clavipes]|uniref:Uncharacterized protein n=1 Tax=Trichonephila clavipes TaxID=2585209 RepID=A0A8X6RFK2_TRICX|nr:hypothetical protein TNCV_4293761 [Trichonephila clavipes]